MLNLARLAEAPAADKPFPHMIAAGLLALEDKAPLARDFPEETRTGFFPVEELRFGPAFARLIEAIGEPDFSRTVGDKLGRDLTAHPQMIVVRKWSAAKDGRPHTDGTDKVATALIYLNDDWDVAGGGALRFLETPDLDGPGSSAVPARYGGFCAFLRSDHSWHGHKPFEGERRVVQVFWVKDGDAVARKQRRHQRGKLLKALWPFGRKPG